MRTKPLLTSSPPGSAEPSTANAAAMPLPRFLTLRNGIYYFKRKNPADVVRADKTLQVQVWKSLETSVLKVAVAKLADEVEQFDAAVACVRTRLAASPRLAASAKPRVDGTTKYMLEAHIPAVLERYEYAYLQADDEQRQGSTKEERREMLREAEEGLEFWYDAASADDFSTIEETADMLLSGERLIAPPGSNVRAVFLPEMLKKEIQLLQTVRDRMRGSMTLTPRVAPVAARYMTTLLDLFDHWRAKQGLQRTIDAYRGYVQDFEAQHGALPVVSIVKHHVFEFRDALANQGLVRATVENRVKGLMTLVTTGTNDGVLKLEANPFSGVDFDSVLPTPPSERRRPFYVEELQQLFSSKLYTDGYRSEGQAREALYWAPLLGAFTGARLEELAQLCPADVRQVNGVWVVRIVNLDPEQHLKTDGSFRTVPIHKELVECGFLKYVHSVRSAGSERIFAALRNDNKYKLWSNALGKAFGRYLDDIGLNDKRLDFQSFRYTFRQQCANCEIETEVRDDLTGHWVTNGDAGRTYLQGADRQYPLPALVAAMKRLTYIGLDLSHVHDA